MIKQKKYIETKYLRTFYHVFKCKSFTAAAEFLCMTQPAVSQHIKKIEMNIGNNVFNRANGFELTKEGEILFKHSEKRFCLINELFDDLDKLKLRKHYKIAISHSFCSDFIIKFLNELSLFDDFDLSIIHFHSDKKLNYKDFDLVFGVKIPTHLGKIVYVKTNNYVISSQSKELLYRKMAPKRIVYCCSLEQSVVVDLISSHGGYTEQVNCWISTSSSEIIQNELKEPETVAVCPKWYINDLKYSSIVTNEHIHMHMWYNVKSLFDVRFIRLLEHVESLINIQHDEYQLEAFNSTIL